MRRFALHWQILVALILAILFGLMFQSAFRIQASQYQVVDAYLTKHYDANRAGDVILAMQSIEGRSFAKRAALQKALNENLAQELRSKEANFIAGQAMYNDIIPYVSWMGNLFLRALKMIIIPLILSSLISGVTGIGSASSLGRIGLKTITYYLTTSLLAICTGLLFVNLFKPGFGADIGLAAEVEGLAGSGSFVDTLMGIVPENIFNAFSQGHMLSVIFFAILFGFFINKVGKHHRQVLKEFFDSVFEVMMKLTMFVIKFTPFGIFGIVAKVVAEQDDFMQLVQSMGKYMGVVVLGLMVHSLITLPAMLRLIGKVNPLKHIRALSTPLLTAFSTSSSSATLPLTIEAVENKCGVSNKISSFCLPLGATINMDGTALYECVAALFIAQAYGIELGFFAQFIVVMTALLASIGAAGIPMAGLVMITVVLTAVKLPLEGVGLILAVDRILDMFRTTVNVFSDSCGAVIVAHSEGESLKV